MDSRIILLENVELEVVLNSEEEESIAEYLRTELGCCDDDFRSLMAESKRLFEIIFRHDNKNKKSAGVNREKIIESVKYTAKNIVNNELGNYPWIRSTKSNKSLGTIQNIN